MPVVSPVRGKAVKRLKEKIKGKTSFLVTSYLITGFLLD